MKMVHYMYLYLSSTFLLHLTDDTNRAATTVLACDSSAVNADMHTMRGPFSNHSPGPSADTITCAARFVPSSIARSR